ncbi:hypothetical protein PGRAN_11253 [Listeria grandensis FSL F6-0971]|uniref:Uncharacterized protein n=1 Tax=Listeria grandensis FSL F6-0971 TaxID=1265819 RepID=W7BRT9_9LIST|nr:hypothetical protein PGRAN_11253 [Listeria grandensis FSL F6-0971]
MNVKFFLEVVIDNLFFWILANDLSFVWKNRQPRTDVYAGIFNTGFKSLSFVLIEMCLESPYE